MDTKDKNPDLISSEAVISDTDSIQPPVDLLEVQDISTLPPEMLAPTIEQGKKDNKPLTPLQESLRRLRRDIRAMVSLGALIFFVVLAIVGPSIYQKLGDTYPSDLSGRIGPGL